MKDKRVVLPNCLGLHGDKIREHLLMFDLYAYFVEGLETGKASLEFIRYLNGLKVGEEVKALRAIDCLLSVNRSPFYKESYIRYDGPILRSKQLNMLWYNEGADSSKGTGGAFKVRYLPLEKKGMSIDGDTTVFWYPKDVYQAIPSPVKSLRYFLIDAPEIWPGGEEKWGQAATDFVERVLTEADSIVVQTDPDDQLFDPFGRLLGWVWFKQKGRKEYYLLNYWIVRQGFARVAYRFGAGQKPLMQYKQRSYQAWLEYALEKAKDEKLGIFGNKLDSYWDDRENIPRHRS